MPVLESMACGTPVITSNNSSLPEVTGDAAILLDDPKNPESIADAMNTILKDKEKRLLLSRNGIEQALKFSPEKIADSLLKVYSKLLS